MSRVRSRSDLIVANRNDSVKRRAAVNERRAQSGTFLHFGYDVTQEQEALLRLILLDGFREAVDASFESPLHVILDGGDAD